VNEKPNLLIQEYYPDGQMKAHVEIRMQTTHFPKFVVVLCAIAALTTVVSFTIHFNQHHNGQQDNGNWSTSQESQGRNR
jgi:hypothetical protein